MGLDAKKRPPLPAPTETDTGTELATDLSRVSRATDKTSQTLPEDGTPVVISTRKKKQDRGAEALARGSHQSQTSLLIEYFEGGKETQAETRRPSVRVKVTPSSKSRGRSANDHIQITETKGTRKPSYTKRINLSSKGDRVMEGEGDTKSVSSYNSATEESNVSRNPIEIEVMPRRHGSPLIPTGGSNIREVHQLGSDISSMPADSFLDGKTRSPERKRSRSLTRGEALAAGAVAGLATVAVADKLRAPSRRRSRSLSRERMVAQKVVEKVKGDKSERRKQRSSSGSRSVSNSEKHTEAVRSPRRRSSRSHVDESVLSGGDVSQVTGSRVSVDQRSFRSGTSKSSINNPKLLETVEDAIRRLILPELTALKKEQKANANRDRVEHERRGSITSGSTGISRDSREETSTRKISYRSSAPDVSSKPKVTVDGREVISADSRKIRKERHESPRGSERGVSEETISRDEDRVRNKRSGEKRSGFGALAAGLGLGALAATALQNNSRENLDERQERRRRRAKSRSRSDSLTESYEEGERHHEVIPPMPLMSEINPSEVTRSSILSVETERPHSASAERLMTPIREVQRGFASPSSKTPTRSPNASHQSTPTGRKRITRSELSQESLRSQEAHLQDEYELDEQGRKVAMHEPHDAVRSEEYHEEGYAGDRSRELGPAVLGAAAGAVLGAAAMHHHDRQHGDGDEEEDSQYYQQLGEVPPPLRYVPYNAEKRGLSPIQSVSGYTEDENVGYHQTRNSGLTRSAGSYSTMDQSPQHQRSAKSVDSDHSVLRGNRHDFAEVRQGGLADSELTQDQDGEYWEEQHRENDRNRDVDGEGYPGYDPQADYKHMTTYTDDSSDVQYHEKVTAGQNVRGVGANPDYVHTPVGVESAVASLVSVSALTAGSGRSGLDRQASDASYDEGAERDFTSRGHSPRKYDDRPRDLAFSGSDQDYISQQNSPTKYPEYDLDDQGRKVTMPNYAKPHGSGTAALVGAVAGAAAVALANRHGQGRESPHLQHEERGEETGAPLQKSFKERAMDMQPRSWRHSVDKLTTGDHEHDEPKMTASSIPDPHNPIPEIGFGDYISEADTNHSYVEGPLAGQDHGDRDHWPNLETPPQPKLDISTITGDQGYAGFKTVGAGLVGSAIGAVGAEAIVNHDREGLHDHDDRTSDDRKRETIITNPFEGTSPVTLLGGQQDRNLLGQMGYDGMNSGYAGGSPTVLPKDEGYISSVPNNPSPGAATPERRVKGVGFMDDTGIGHAAGPLTEDDPFYTPKHARQLSGMSHGMDSPFYDSATGNGIDRIQSRDIVALMDHLTVRDAQRSARDTEILVTLVRSAAEMRNSFEDMKRLLTDTEDVIITETQRNTEKTVQKAINGPRPLPPSASRSLRGSQDDTIEDLPNKRRNVFRRALKGLSMRSSNDLAKIEEMLVQLLGEVEGLKVSQGLQGRGSQSDPFDSLQQEDGTYEQDRGYEPEGNAGTSSASHASQSGHFSNPLSRGASASRGFEGRKFSENRISTVPEGDEEALDPDEQDILANQFENNEHLLTPTREDVRGGSVPAATPPQQYVAPVSLSHENTPRTDKSKKHKSSSSSGWIPKISRWSETTASTVARGFRRSGRADSEQFEQPPPSRSGSDLGTYDGLRHNPYGEDKLHSGFSHEDMAPTQFDETSPQLASLLPPEDPKYKAHRNSLNLQHPQPRPGPTHRYQTALESQAQEFGSPMSPKSLEWGSSTSVNRLPPNANANRYSTQTATTGQLSPVSDAGFSHHSPPPGLAAGPVKPPKEPIGSSPPAPQRPPKIRTKLTKPSPLSNEHLDLDGMDDDKRFSNGTVSTAAGQVYGSPQSATRVMSANLGVPTRKPTGPRSMGERSRSGNMRSPEGSGGEGHAVGQRKRDTFGTVASNHSVESETF